ncbi:hypothetical protein L0U85_04830 [Glycomyces sp. L485]|uniref:hypothetical protein n=1 Tax=Glycomyces sp. L485 TaxID=2909235 RepID=UPI001F4A15F7|nr:hypothetical protein [Glycomyces sp. L485]MCH7230190.1 hypothetical protein [Glycomyces sp. L485]
MEAALIANEPVSAATFGGLVEVSPPCSSTSRSNVSRDCRLRGTGAAEVMAGIAHLHNRTLAR